MAKGLRPAMDFFFLETLTNSISTYPSWIVVSRVTTGGTWRVSRLPSLST